MPNPGVDCASELASTRYECFSSGAVFDSDFLVCDECTDFCEAGGCDDDGHYHVCPAGEEAASGTTFEAMVKEQEECALELSSSIRVSILAFLVHNFFEKSFNLIEVIQDATFEIFKNSKWTP